MSINVYGVDDDKKVIYPLRVSSTLVPDRHRLVGSQLSNHSHAVYCGKQCLHACSNQELFDAHSTDCCHTQRTKFPEDPRCRFINIQYL